MTPSDASVGLVASLMKATTFEQASQVTMAAILGASIEDTKASDARAVVHLRTLDAYQHVVSAELPSTRIGAAKEMPSTNAWRWVLEKKSVVVDVQLALVSELGEASVMADIRPKEAVAIDTHATQKRLMQRMVTHLVAWPLLAPGGALGGMLSLELACRERVGRPIFSDDTRRRLTALVGIAGPFLVSLPVAPFSGLPDELLPVVGKRTAPLVEMMGTFSMLDDTLLLVGPTGVGKSKLARYCHAHSPRRDGPFETVDLGSIPEDLQLAELFGWQRGAFTGAVKENSGAVARASGGTLFVDEIDKLSLKAQAGTLRLFDERKYRSLGDENEHTADVRLVVGTNADLRECVRRGTFREDLLYRISVLPIEVPSLDERNDEVVDWAKYFLKRVDATAAWDEASLQLLKARRWPGNLRQLDNVVRRSLAIARMRKGHVTIKPPDVLGAIGSEPEDSGGVAEHLLRAARVFVERAKRVGPTDLDLADAFRGFVMGAALARTESDEEALKLLKQDKALGHRNAKRLVRNYLQRARELCMELGERYPFDDRDEKHPFEDSLRDEDQA